MKKEPPFVMSAHASTRRQAPTPLHRRDKYHTRWIAFVLTLAVSYVGYQEKQNYDMQHSITQVSVAVARQDQHEVDATRERDQINHHLDQMQGQLDQITNILENRASRGTDGGK